MTQNFSLGQKGGPAVDRGDGVIRGVSVITEGATLNGWTADTKTLQMLEAAGKASVDGVATRFNHGGGVETTVGACRNFRIVGNQLAADLHLLTAHEAYASIVEMAESIPSTFGLSISADPTMEGNALRPKYLSSIDLVTTPAANPGGLFAGPSARPTQAQLRQLAGILGVSAPTTRVNGAVVMDEPALYENCQSAAFSKHVRFPSMASDATLAKQYKRAGLDILKGVALAQRGFLQDSINKIFAA